LGSGWRASTSSPRTHREPAVRTSSRGNNSRLFSSALSAERAAALWTCGLPPPYVPFRRAPAHSDHSAQPSSGRSPSEFFCFLESAPNTPVE
jgi:hypothetical protein